ncbi:MAG: aspartate ammonia-lyase [Clostridium sp.]|uniref:aspartate ammonia-lyase n=1 Tax=Clostridium sp. TaxID=1506 RepID=UPI0025BE8F4E|nr:aspartate ammonia-lyase [Clostridium sp.]MCH3962827.1 aspartate ammonia-lyase [Clostridium sp.]MCI1715758.1 aspartate ammonia-lyase [Clostridium sp.]MCI1800037.1 aspartate ammonia-lyase [Clostridium sp.]MCI1813951.1 aspartate ammonia-lyase [Clostridium sp.]MCI1870849.1 aspartate ammonia-lyase [Clostridium sp.]
MRSRIEKDLLGERKISDLNYFGINTLRALENFDLQGKINNVNLIREIALIKKAAAIVNRNLNNISDKKAAAIIKASEEAAAGKFDGQFKLSAFQGGAGTSTNMNVNEVIANRAIELLGGKKGDYSLVHPLNDVNMSQSTNDVYPTALRIAAIRAIRKLSSSLADLQNELQIKENEFSDILKLGRTELMDALPMMAGQGFGAYSRAISRDRWRIYKVEERLREVNIGGTAIGTGFNASNKFIYEITDVLQDLTGLGIARSDYPMDITQNCDVFVEVSGLLKSLAVNLMKISSDLRILNSGPKGGIGEVILPEVQAGSTIMPGKVNPVIAEMVAQVSMRVISNDAAITMAAGSGQLELNAFVPLIAECLLESLELLERAVVIFGEKCIKSININEENCRKNIEASTAAAAALVHYIGYDRTSELAKKALKDNRSIKDILYEMDILPRDKIDEILNPYQLTKPGIPGKYE